MTNTSWDEEAIAKGMKRLRNAERVVEYVKAPLEEAIHFEGERAFLVASDDLLILLVFSYINFLGYLYKGRDEAICAVDFIRDYLGKIDQRYVEVGGLLYVVLRNGMFHRVTPKRIKLQDGKILDFSFHRARRREDSFKIEKWPESRKTGEATGIYKLALNIPLMYRDLLSAIDKYIEDIRDCQELSDTFSRALETRRKPERVESFLGRNYTQDSDIDLVMKQISNL